MSEAMAEAFRMADQSTCVRRKVGAVLLDSVGTMRGRGYNKESDGKCDTDCPRAHLTYAETPAGSPYFNCIAVHAEMVALKEAGCAYTKGWTMMVTCEPCIYCQAILDVAQIHVVYDHSLR